MTAAAWPTCWPRSATRRRTRRTTPTWSSSTPAISATRRRRRCSPSWAGCGWSRTRAPREGERTILAVAGCVAQAEGAEIVARAPYVDIVLGPQTYHRLPEMVARAARAAGAVIETDFPAEDKVRPPAGCRRAAGADRVPDHPGGLRQVLQLLRRALHARRRSEPAGGGRARRGAAAGGAGRARDHAARPERQCLARRRPPTARRRSLGRAACAGWPRSRGLARIRYTTSHPRDMDDELIAAHRRCAGADAVPASAGAVGLRPHARGDEPPPHRRGLSAHRRAAARGAAGHRAVVGLHRRPSRRDRGRFRGDAGAGPRGRLRPGVQLQILAPPRHARPPARRRRWPSARRTAGCRRLQALLREQQAASTRAASASPCPCCSPAPAAIPASWPGARRGCSRSI